MSAPFSIKPYTPSPRMMRNLGVITGAGVAITLAGLYFAPERAWANLLLANQYVIGVGLGAAFFLAIGFVSHAGWHVAIRRVPEAMTSLLIVGAIVFVLTTPGLQTLYPWSRAWDIAHDHVVAAKTGWLNIPFFVTRSLTFLGLWTVLAFAMTRASRAQDADGDVKFTERTRILGAVFLSIFGISATLAGMDWLMTLEPRWFSTIFGIYNIAGMFLTSLATMAVIVIVLRRVGTFRTVLTDKHLHDLGKYIFAFSTFWMYIWFSQYLLIWYANIPEEVTYFVRREQGGWGIFTIVNLLFNWVIPFVLLLPAWTKKNEGVLLRVSIVIMIGHWIDLFWMIQPNFMKEAPVFNIWEFGPIAAAIAGTFYVVFKVLSKGNVVPVRDPLLVESLPHP